MKYNRTHTTVEPITIPVTTHITVYLGNGFKRLLGAMLFPSNPAHRNQIMAIKALRAELGISLKEAKDVADALTPTMLGLVEADHSQDHVEGVTSLGGLLRRKLNIDT